jgi:hypothetical protein
MKNAQLQRATQATEHIDKALDMLYDAIDSAFSHGEFKKVDQFLGSVLVPNIHTDILLGILIATLSARSKLPNRPAFFCKVQTEFNTRGETDPNLLNGLL